MELPSIARDQFDDSCRQLSAQRIAVESSIGNDTPHFLTRTAAAIPPTYADQGKRLLGEPELGGGRKVKQLSRGNTVAVVHRHAFCTLAPLRFSDFRANFLSGARLTSRNDSLQLRCSRLLSSAARNSRQIVRPAARFTRSPYRRQQLAGEGKSSRTSQQDASLRRNHKTLSSILQSLAEKHLPRDFWGIGGTRARFSGIARRSAAVRIASSGLPWCCCPVLSRVSTQLNISHYFGPSIREMNALSDNSVALQAGKAQRNFNEGRIRARLTGGRKRNSLSVQNTSWIRERASCHGLQGVERGHKRFIRSGRGTGGASHAPILILRAAPALLGLRHSPRGSTTPVES
jgi:hypothetical protein